MMSLLVLIRYRSASPKAEDMEWPPSLSIIVEKAPMVGFCELVSNPARYNNKIVRTEAVFWSNKENVALYSLDCDDPNKNAWAEFDESYVYTNESVQKKLVEVLCPRTQCPVSKAVVGIVGRFEWPNEQGYGHLNDYRFRFSIMRVEKAEPLTIIEAKSR